MQTLDDRLLSFREQSKETLADATNHSYPFVNVQSSHTRNIRDLHHERSLTCYIVC
jgi:hypothetical protein